MGNNKNTSIQYIIGDNNNDLLSDMHRKNLCKKKMFIVSISYYFILLMFFSRVVIILAARLACNCANTHDCEYLRDNEDCSGSSIHIRRR